jgi:hypothetical protein
MSAPSKVGTDADAPSKVGTAGTAPSEYWITEVAAGALIMGFSPPRRQPFGGDDMVLAKLIATRVPDLALVVTIPDRFFFSYVVDWIRLQRQSTLLYVFRGQVQVEEDTEPLQD